MRFSQAVITTSLFVVLPFLVTADNDEKRRPKGIKGKFLLPFVENIFDDLGPAATVEPAPPAPSPPLKGDSDGAQKKSKSPIPATKEAPTNVENNDLVFPDEILSSDSPSLTPSDAPSTVPSDIPSRTPIEISVDALSDIPSLTPSDAPSMVPSDAPSSIPSDAPSSIPSDAPSSIPSDAPSSIPSDAPSSVLSDTSSNLPSDVPSNLV